MLKSITLALGLILAVPAVSEELTPMDQQFLDQITPVGVRLAKCAQATDLETAREWAQGTDVDWALDFSQWYAENHNEVLGYSAGLTILAYAKVCTDNLKKLTPTW